MRPLFSRFISPLILSICCSLCLLASAQVKDPRLLDIAKQYCDTMTQNLVPEMRGKGIFERGIPYATKKVLVGQMPLIESIVQDYASKQTLDSVALVLNIVFEEVAQTCPAYQRAFKYDGHFDTLFSLMNEKVCPCFERRTAGMTPEQAVDRLDLMGMCVAEAGGQDSFLFHSMISRKKNLSDSMFVSLGTNMAGFFSCHCPRVWKAVFEYELEHFKSNRWAFRHQLMLSLRDMIYDGIVEDQFPFTQEEFVDIASFEAGEAGMVKASKEFMQTKSNSCVVSMSENALKMLFLNEGGKKVAFEIQASKSDLSGTPQLISLKWVARQDIQQLKKLEKALPSALQVSSHYLTLPDYR